MTSSPSSRAGASCSSTPRRAARAACNRPSSTRPPRHAIASTSRWDGRGHAATRAASSSATSALADVGAHGRPVPPPAVGSRPDAVAAQRVDQLDGLVGVAAVCGSITRPDRAASPAPGAAFRQQAPSAAKGRFPAAAAAAPPARSSGQRRRQRVRRIHLVLAVGADQQQALDRLVAQHEVDEADRGAPAHCRSSMDHHDRALAASDGAQRVEARLRPGLRVSGSPGSGGTASSDGQLRHHRGSRPALGPAPPGCAARSSASSASGSASSSRPSARSAWWTASKATSWRYWSNLPATNQPSPRSPSGAARRSARSCPRPVRR